MFNQLFQCFLSDLYMMLIVLIHDGSVHRFYLLCIDQYVVKWLLSLHLEMHFFHLLSIINNINNKFDNISFQHI